MQSQTSNPTEDILTSEDFYFRADSGKRFLNYLIDIILFYAIFFSIGIIVIQVSPSIAESLAVSDDGGFAFFDRIFTILLYAVYMSVVEAIFKGRSLGKLITRTKAVNMDGSSISTGTAFARGFSRAVPFCVFSAFGNPSNPWQDRWTNTMVIDLKKKSELN